MTIDALIDPPVELLVGASRRPDVSAAFDDALASLARLRFHEGLRRGWEEARAEAAVREAAAVALILGARTTVDELRLATLADAPVERPAPGSAALVDPRPRTGRDPAMDLAIGAFRSQAGILRDFAPLNARTPSAPRSVPIPALLAGIHRDLCSGLVESGRLATERVAIPASAEVLAPALRILSAPAPALARAAGIVAHFRFREVFAPASAGVGAALARRLLVVEGVDPTGACAISALDAQDPAGASRALAGWVRADEDGLARWMLRFAESVEFGARVGVDVALHVQAGRLG